MNCPICKDSGMAPTLTRKGVEVDFCPRCEGIWLDKNEIFLFAKAAKNLEMKMEEEIKKEKESSLLSPSDQRPMLELSFPWVLKLYYCRNSGGVWVPKEEIERTFGAKAEISIDRAMVPHKTMQAPSAAQMLTLPNLTAHSSLAVFLLYFLLGLFLIFLVKFANFPPFGAVLIGMLIAIAQFLFGPNIMDFCLKVFYRTKWVDTRELPTHLVQFIETVSRKQNIKFPRIGIIADGSPNAFTYGRHPNDARIVLTEGIMDLLQEDELQAVVAHEIGHIVHWDMFIMTVVQVVPLVLYYIYRSLVRMRSKGRDKSAPYRYIAASVSYIFYIISEYVVLWFSRIREFYADRFSGEVTGNPSILSRALVKIGYGLAGQEVDKTKGKERREQLQAIGAMGIFDRKYAQALAITGYSKANTMGTEVNKESVKHAAKWDLWNPWAKYFELHSTHPLIANRLRYLSNQSAAQGKEPYINFDLRQPESYWDEFIFDVLIKFAPFIALLIAVLTVMSQSSFSSSSLGLCLFFLGMGYGVQLYFSYASEIFPEMTVASLLKKVKVSGVRPVPCSIKGTIIGRGIPGYIFSEDFVLQDNTGIIFLDYQQPLAIFNLLFGLLRAQHYINQKVEVVGWYRRTPVPYLELKEIKLGIGDTAECYVFLAKIIAVVLLLFFGIVLFFS